MTNYARMYRFGITPWERYGPAAAASITALLDREETGRPRPLGRALDLGCGRGQYTPELARRGWEAVGIDYVPAAIEAAAAKTQGADRLRYVVGDVTRLPSAHLGTFDFFLDIGCFQGLEAGQRLSQGEGVSALADPGATLLLLSFGPSRWRAACQIRTASRIIAAAKGSMYRITTGPAEARRQGWATSPASARRVAVGALTGPLRATSGPRARSRPEEGAGSWAGYLAPVALSHQTLCCSDTGSRQ
jgi:SAM-dependent methyltransferase